MENITIEDRKNIKIKGASKVLSSTNNQTVVEIHDCNLVLTGSGLELTKLDLENKEVFISGEINSLKYTRKSEKVGFIKRLLK